MGLAELFLLAVGLSMDAFAVAVCAGLTMRQATFKKMLTMGLYFGLFQAGMPIIGYLAGTFFAGYIVSFDHWIAFFLLCYLGGKMIWGGISPEDEDGKDKPEAKLTPGYMLPLALATSIDALAVGISLAFLRVDIVPAATFIGAVTFAISMAGVKVGCLFGAKYKSGAEIFGGVILALIGLKILLEHLGILIL